ncbi:hypothetical protein BC567DRAFT_218812 [Phyllosticta citribraziliensis]
MGRDGCTRKAKGIDRGVGSRHFMSTVCARIVEIPSRKVGITLPQTKLQGNSFVPRLRHNSQFDQSLSLVSRTSTYRCMDSFLSFLHPSQVRISISEPLPKSSGVTMTLLERTYASNPEARGWLQIYVPKAIKPWPTGRTRLPWLPDAFQAEGICSGSWTCVPNSQPRSAKRARLGSTHFGAPETGNRKARDTFHGRSTDRKQ